MLRVQRLAGVLTHGVTAWSPSSGNTLLALCLSYPGRRRQRSYRCVARVAALTSRPAHSALSGGRPTARPWRSRGDYTSAAYRVGALALPKVGVRGMLCVGYPELMFYILPLAHGFSHGLYVCITAARPRRSGGLGLPLTPRQRQGALTLRQLRLVGASGRPCRRCCACASRAAARRCRRSSLAPASSRRSGAPCGRVWAPVSTSLRLRFSRGCSSLSPLFAVSSFFATLRCASCRALS